MRETKDLSYNDACLFLSELFSLPATWDGLRVNEKHDMVHTVIIKNENRNVMIELDMKLGCINIIAEKINDDYIIFRCSDYVAFYDIDASLVEAMKHATFTDTKESKEVLCNIRDILNSLDNDFEIGGMIKRRIEEMQPHKKHNAKEHEEYIAMLDA